MSGNGPTPTSPLFATDEHIAMYAMADYHVLCPKWGCMAEGRDGTMAMAAPWVLSSATVNFQAQGVCPQTVASFSGPRDAFPGGGAYLLAVDSVSGNSVTLRRIGLGLGEGQPPALAADLSQVCFSMLTLRPQIDGATYRIKDRFSIDEVTPFRATGWVYSGVEDDDPAPRIFRDAVTFETLADLYENAMREQTENGDFARKAKRYRVRSDEAISRLQIRWGPTGNSAEPDSIMSCRLTR